jgi:hypothetical protein
MHPEVKGNFCVPGASEACLQGFRCRFPVGEAAVVRVVLVLGAQVGSEELVHERCSSAVA